MTTDNRIMRVHYYERQFLRAQDFTDEQAYHIAMRRRHNLAHHIWGIVRGLELEFNVSDNRFVVKPGIAVDGYGRELILTAEKLLGVGEFDSRGVEQIDVWLEYRLLSMGQTRANDECPVDEEMAVAFDRWLEQPEVVLTSDTVYDQDRRSPRSVPVGQNFNATLMPPDSPELYFPVYLGQICRITTNNRIAYSARLTGRPYAGLVGREIVHPAGKVRVVLGEKDGNDKARFTVDIHADQPDSQPTLTVDPPENIDQPDQIAFNGNVTVNGDAAIAGALQFSIPRPNPNAEKGQEAQQTQAAAATSRPGVIFLDKPDEESAVRELRVELAATANPDTPSSFAVGVWSEQEKKFKPIFRVDENGVTISGTLVANEVLKPLKPVRTSEEALAILRNRRLSDQVMNNAGVLNLLGKLVEGVFSRRGDADDDIPRQ